MLIFVTSEEWALLDIHVKKSTPDKRDSDITNWEDVSLSALNARQKRRFQKHKVAIVAYFTTHASLNEIAQQHNIAVSNLHVMIERCLLYHEDGQVWGFRALLPGMIVVNHRPRDEQEIAPVQEADPKDAEYVDENDDITEKRLHLY